MRIGIIASIGRHFDSFWTPFVERASRAGHEVYLAAGVRAENHQVTVIDGLTRKPAIANVSAIAGVREWVDSNRLDVVITNTAVCSTIVRIARLRCPVVYFAHGLHWPRVTDLRSLHWLLIEGCLASRADGFIVLNREDYKWVTRRKAPDSILYLPLGIGVPLDEFPFCEDVPPGRLVWIGEFSDRKRPELALDLLKSLRDRGVEVELAMLGDGPLRAGIEAKAREYGMIEYLRLPGRTAVQPELTQASALVHTASWEGLPRVALEALAMGRPVVALPAKGLAGVPGVLTTENDSLDELSILSQKVLECPADFRPKLERGLLDVSVVASSVLSFVEGLVPEAERYKC